MIFNIFKDEPTDELIYGAITYSFMMFCFGGTMLLLYGAKEALIVTLVPTIIVYVVMLIVPKKGK